jgi:hypothetical protein
MATTSGADAWRLAGRELLMHGRSEPGTSGSLLDAPTSFPVGVLLVVSAAICAILLLAPGVQTARAAACPNESIRADQGAAAQALPSCRAYELVSPGSLPSISEESVAAFGGGKASPTGDALSYVSRYPAAGSTTSSYTWLSRRTGDGWVVSGLEPQSTQEPSNAGPCNPGVALSEDLSSYLLSAGGADVLSQSGKPVGECGTPMEELVSGEPRGFSNLYVRRDGGPYALANPVPAGAAPGNATYQAASADLDRVVFSEDARLTLTPEAPSGYNLYEWADGSLRLVGILPSGEAVPAQLGAATMSGFGDAGGAAAGLAPVSHAVSADGERVFFEANGNLYLRENAGQPPAANPRCATGGSPGLACTVQVDQTHWVGESGGGVFQFASRDGGRVFFTSDHALTEENSVTAGSPDLYEYDVATGGLTDLSLAPSGAAGVQGISGGSDDGSYVYFVARGTLTGSQQNREGEVAQLGEPNLYVTHDGALTYVATLSPWELNGGKDSKNWWDSHGRGALETVWSPSGRFLLFPSYKSLTGFDNSQAEGAIYNRCKSGKCKEIFLYDAASGSLTCISCEAGGGRPLGDTTLYERQEFIRGFGPRYLPRTLSDDGRVFFETVNPLVPDDVNGFQDVYEYRAGQFKLMSTGTAVGGSAFLDASADGRDVFIATPQSLLRSDTDGGLPSIYDVRVDGGFVEPPPPPEPCGGESGCRPGGQVAPAGTPAATVVGSGDGNFRAPRCGRRQIRRHGHCVKKVHRHRHHAHHGRAKCKKRRHAAAKKDAAKCRQHKASRGKQRKARRAGKTN